jgi:hypothetical protein
VWLIDQLAEERIGEAQRAGAFDDLPGSGQPLSLEDDSAVSAELRTAYRLLKNAGYLPPELELRREIADTRQLLALAEQSEERASHSRRLRYLMTRLGIGRAAPANLQTEQAYFDRLCEKLERRARQESEPDLRSEGGSAGSTVPRRREVAR